jgi:DNA repair ATPase RecN
MSQRVNIQYSVKIDDLEEEVQRLASKAFSILGDCVSNNNHIGNISLSVGSHRNIDQLRLNLSDVDAILADVNMIIGSFLSYKSQEMMQSVPRPPNPLENTAAVPAELSELQEKISKFKSSLAEVENSGQNDADIR